MYKFFKRFILLLIILLITNSTFTMAAEKPRWVGLPIYVHIEEYGEYTRLMEKAFLAWEEISDDLIRFDFVSRPSNANIHVKFVDYVENCNSELAIGCTRITQRGGQYYRSDVEIAMNIRYEDGILRPIRDVYSVMLHEIGHAIGLGHSNSIDSIMYPYAVPTLQYLTDEDFNLLYKKYH